MQTSRTREHGARLTSLYVPNFFRDEKTLQNTGKGVMDENEDDPMGITILLEVVLKCKPRTSLGKEGCGY